MPILLDANVIYGQTLRDTFMHLAANRVIEVRWTNQIHEEWIAALLEKRSDLTREALLQVRDLMNLHAADSFVTGYESLIEKLDLPDPDDRHVLAAAIHSGYQTLVTLNAKDFPRRTLERHNIELQRPDAFLVELLNNEPNAVIRAAKQQRAQLRKPARSVEEQLKALAAHGLPRFAGALKPFADQI